MMAAGAGTDMVTGLGNLILSGIDMANRNRLQRDQLRLQSRALDLQEQQLAVYSQLANPISRYSLALTAGFDPTSARQVAGSSELRTIGAAQLHPVDSHTLQNLQRSHVASQFAAANRVFIEGLPNSGGINRPIPYNQLPGNNRPNFARRWNESNA